MQMFTETLHDYIFADFIHSVKVEADRDTLISEAQALKALRETVYVSNRGYQSIPYHRGSPQPLLDSLDATERVVESCYEYASEFLINEHQSTIEKTQWWVNLNTTNEFNVPHNHGRCDLMGLYYVSAPSQSGRLVIERNDGSSYNSLYDNVSMGRRIEIDPEEGRLYLLPGHLLHWVESNLSEDPRISLAVNFYLH